MKLGLMVGTPELRRPPTQMLLGGPDLEGNLRRLADWGYDGVELGLRDPALLDGRQIQSWLAQYHLEMPALCTGEVFGQDGLAIIGMPADVMSACEARLRAIIDFGAEFGDGVVVTLGRVRGKPDQQAPQQSFALGVAAFQRLSDYAAPKGVRLALEPANHHEVSFIMTTQEGLAFVAEVNRPNFGLMLDTYHMNIEEQNVHASLRAARRYNWHMHIADNNRKWPGNAHFDFAQIVATLDDLGYEGYLSGEMLPWPDAETAGRETIHYMRRWVPKRT
jgi:sugar phosphate isomerase/epimerase